MIKRRQNDIYGSDKVRASEPVSSAKEEETIDFVQVEEVTAPSLRKLNNQNNNVQARIIMRYLWLIWL